MNTPEELQAEVQHFQESFQTLRDQICTAIVGQDRTVEATLTALLCGGNVLLEGLPGLGKTELVKALAKVFDLEFRRIQFTPDLMPADIVGTNVLTTNEEGRYRIEFRPGPIFTQLLLADEINRATPKTQSALLETMQEGTVTVAGEIRTLDQPFFVLATQNPIEQEGTFPLPEAQLDRFLFKLVVPRTDRQTLNEVLDRTILSQPASLDPVVNADELLHLRSIAEKVVVADPVRDYAVRLVLATHPEADESTEAVQRFVQWGASPRAAQALIQAARVHALTNDRPQVSFEDVRAHALQVLQHRVLLNYDGQAEAVSVQDLIQDSVNTTPENLSTLQGA